MQGGAQPGPRGERGALRRHDGGGALDDSRGGGAIRIGAVLHDIGKICLDDAVLGKPARLDEAEVQKMREHPARGFELLRNVGLPPLALEIVRSHHERADGGGYPDGLSGDEVPMAARIAQVADAYDALTTDRNYRKGISHDLAMKELRKHEGTQFDSSCLDALDRVIGPPPEK